MAIPQGAVTGSGYKLGYRPVCSASGVAYSPVAWLTKFTPPKLSMDGADTTLLSGLLKTKTPTLAEYEASGTMQVVEPDPAYAALRQGANAGTYFSFQMLHPSGAMLTWDGWFSAFEPGELTVDDVRTVDFTIMVQTVPVPTAATTS